MERQGTTTHLVHGDRHLGVEHNGIRKPIHTSTQYGYEDVEDLIAVFQGGLKGSFSYARQGSPTTAALESKLTWLEQGVGTVCFSSGMGALSALFFSMLRAGDHIISSKFVFGNTNSLLGTLRGFGVDVTLVDPRSVEKVAAAVRPTTRMVFVETIGNPGTQVPDLPAIGRLCRERSLVYVVDNTVPSPALFVAKHVGASLVMNSLSKIVSGHGAALGGSITDTGEFDWSSYPNISPGYKSAEAAQWALLQMRKKGLRDMGAALSSEQAHQIALGMETLELRMERCSATALQIATFLQAHPGVAAVHYPGLPSHPQFEIARNCLASAAWLLSFELKNPGDMYRFINRLRIPIKATGLGDTRTLIIPVAPTIFWEAGPEVRKEMGVTDGMIRLSVGLENAADLIADFEQAFTASS